MIPVHAIRLRVIRGQASGKKRLVIVRAERTASFLLD